MNNINIAQKERMEKALDKQVRVEGEVMARRVFMDKLKQEGAISSKEIVEQKKKIAYLKDEMSKYFALRETKLSDKELEQEIEKAKKTEYRIEHPDGSYHVVSKTEYDYFNKIDAQNKISEKKENRVCPACSTMLKHSDFFNLPLCENKECSRYGLLIAENVRPGAIEKFRTFFEAAKVLGKLDLVEYKRLIQQEILFC